MVEKNNTVTAKMILRELRYDCYKLLNRYKYDTKVMYALLSEHIEYYYYLPTETRNNIELCIKLVSYNPYYYEKISTEMQTNKHVAMAFADNADGYSYRLLHNDLKYDRLFNKHALLNNYRIYTALPTDIRRDRELLVELFKQSFKYTINPEFFDITFADDKEVILGWIPHFGGTIADRITDRLKQDRKVVLALVKYDGSNITKVDRSFLYDKEILLTALRTYPDAYNMLPSEHELKSDDEILNLVLNEDDIEIKGIAKVRKGDNNAANRFKRSE